MAVLGESLIYKRCSGVSRGSGWSMYFVLILSFYLLNQLTPLSSSLLYFHSFSLNYCHIFSITAEFPRRTRQSSDRRL